MLQGNRSLPLFSLLFALIAWSGTAAPLRWHKRQKSGMDRGAIRRIFYRYAGVLYGANLERSETNSVARCRGWDLHGGAVLWRVAHNRIQGFLPLYNNILWSSVPPSLHHRYDE